MIKAEKKEGQSKGKLKLRRSPLRGNQNTQQKKQAD
jgi:hypothetical protein